MKYISICVLLIACIVACGCTAEKLQEKHVAGGNMSVIFIDVGQGDSELIIYNNTATLIDGGGTEYGATVVHTLREYGISHLDYVILTHEHMDHMGGLATVENEYDIHNFVYSTCDTKFCIVHLLNPSSGQKMRARAGTMLDLDPDVNMRVLSPPDARFTDVNDNSVVMLLTYGDSSFLFMGDAEKGAEEVMLDTYTWELNVDVLKVGHHGSSGSVTQEFLQVTTPKLVVISVGENNQYGHPAESTLNLLSKIPILRTDIEGTIVIETDGKEIRI
jgi:competence protein ComEC